MEKQDEKIENFKRAIGDINNQKKEKIRVKREEQEGLKNQRSTTTGGESWNEVLGKKRKELDKLKVHKTE